RRADTVDSSPTGSGLRNYGNGGRGRGAREGCSGLCARALATRPGGHRYRGRLPMQLRVRLRPIADWVALREQLLSPGTGSFLDYLGGVICSVSTLAERLDNPVIHAVLRQLEDLFEKVQSQTRDAPLLRSAERVYMTWMQGWIERFDK